MAPSQLPMLECIPIYNRLDRELHISIEPEGDCITIQPSQVCRIVPQHSSEARQVELEIEYKENLISIHLMTVKEIYVDGQRVR